MSSTRRDEMHISYFDIWSLHSLYNFFKFSISKSNIITRTMQMRNMNIVVFKPFCSQFFLVLYLCVKIRTLKDWNKNKSIFLISNIFCLFSLVLILFHTFVDLLCLGFFIIYYLSVQAPVNILLMLVRSWLKLKNI